MAERTTRDRLPTPPRPLRLGLIGCGRLGAGFYIPAIARARGLTLAAIAEPDLGRSLDARELAAKLQGEAVRVCASAASMVASSPPDAVIVAGPPETHLEHAALAAAAGVPALVEKPPASDVVGATELAALEPTPWVGFNRRFAAAGRLLAAAPPNVREIELELSYLRARWRPHVTRVDALADVGCHLVDLALGALPAGEVRVRARRLSVRRVAAELRGGDRTVLIRCAVDRPWRERALLRDGTGNLVGATSLGGPLAGVRLRIARRLDPLTASLVAQLEALGSAARGEGSGRLADAADGLAVMRTLAAIRSSAGSGGAWTEIGGLPGVREEVAA